MSCTNYPRMRNAIFLCFLFIGLQVVFAILYLVVTYFFKLSIMPFCDIYITLLIGVVSSFVPIMVALKKIGKPINEVLLFRKVSWRIWLYTLIFISGFFIINTELDNILNILLPMPRFISDLFDDLMINEKIVPSILGIIILPSFIEEIFCRSIFLYGFSKNYSSVKAIIFSSLLFGLLHLNPWQFLGAFLIGLFSAWIFLQSKSILISIFIHMFNNGLCLLISRIPRINPATWFYRHLDTQVYFQPIWFDVLGVILLLSGLYLLVSHFRKIANISYKDSEL